MCLLMPLAPLGEDATDSASPLSLGESLGINPFPYPPPGVQMPTTWKRYGGEGVVVVRVGVVTQL